MPAGVALENRGWFPPWPEMKSWSVFIPNNPAWLGLSLYHQVVSKDPAANALGATTSNAGIACIGR